MADRTHLGAALISLILTGCAVAPPSGSGPVGTQTAFFAEFPAQLYAAAAYGCQDPADTFTQLSESVIECETLPTPDAAAALILRFDGDIQNLPTMVNRMSAQPQGDGFQVMAEYFFRVPQLDTSIKEVRFQQKDVDRAIRRVFRLAGAAEIAK